jgi:glucose-6-phosphate-specific signal transduction histidine kinase
MRPTAVRASLDVLLTNAVRHAGARRVHIATGREDGVVRAEIDDDGRGFDPKAPADGFGLIDMREGVAVLRTSLRSRPRPGGLTSARRCRSRRVRSLPQQRAAFHDGP